MRQAPVATYAPQPRMRQGGARRKSGGCSSMLSSLVVVAMIAGAAVYLFAFDGLATLQALFNRGSTPSPTRNPTASPVPTVPTLKPTPLPSTLRPSSYVQVVFATPAPSPVAEAAFTNAATKWSNILQGSTLTPTTYTGTETFNDEGCLLDAPHNAVPIPAGTYDSLLIVAVFKGIDGAGSILGQAGPCKLGVTDFGVAVPKVGRMVFDTADIAALESNGRLEKVILHEMGHVLGIGTLWLSGGVLVNPIFPGPSPAAGIPANDPKYIGHAARVEYDTLTGSTGDIPVEDGTFASLTPAEIIGGAGRGSIDGHWRENIFDNELMTPAIGSSTDPLSRMSLRSLEDLGYSVHPELADAYTAPVLSRGSPLSSDPSPSATVLYDDMFIADGLKDAYVEALGKKTEERRLRGL